MTDAQYYNSIQLENKLAALKVPGFVTACQESSFYIDYEIQFDPHVTINKVRARLEDIKIFFGAPVELATTNKVIFRIAKEKRPTVNLLDFKKYIINSKNPLPLSMGVCSDGKKLVYDLAKLPHLLVAGSTGSGKSVFINSCIMSLIWHAQSELVLIDLKRVELSIYNNICCLKSPVITDIRRAEETLIQLCCEMDKRYKTMEKLKVRNFTDLQKIRPDMHYITVVIDEFADLILNNKSLEYYIIRLAQLARAAGIHLILATQRPSADVITGLIKANIPSRICFAVASGIDSRIIIDRKGGENLSGAGDALFLPIGKSDPERLQAPFIDTTTLIHELEYYKR